MDSAQHLQYPVQRCLFDVRIHPFQHGDHAFPLAFHPVFGLKHPRRVVFLHPFQLLPQLPGHVGCDGIGLLVGPAIHFLFVHNGGDGLFFEGFLSGLGALLGSVAFSFGFLALEVGRNAALVCIVVALLELGVLLGQALNIRKGGIPLGFDILDVAFRPSSPILGT